MTYYNLGSAFFPLFFVAFPLLGRVFLWEFCFGNYSCTNGRVNGSKFLLMYLVTLAVPVVIGCYTLWMYTEFFIPILGRTGSNDPPEFIISVFVTLFTLIIVSYSVRHNSFIVVTMEAFQKMLSSSFPNFCKFI